MQVGRLYLDANVLIVLGEGTGEVADLLTELAAQQEPADVPFLCTSELSLAEIFVVPYREQNDELIDRYDGWLVSGSFMEVGPVHRTVIWYASVVRATYKSVKLPDAIHIATAIAFGCTRMLTADTRLPERVELYHRRWGLRKGPARLAMLRPVPEILRRIIEEQKAL